MDQDTLRVNTIEHRLGSLEELIARLERRRLKTGQDLYAAVPGGFFEGTDDNGLVTRTLTFLIEDCAGGTPWVGVDVSFFNDTDDSYDATATTNGSGQVTFVSPNGHIVGASFDDGVNPPVSIAESPWPWASLTYYKALSGNNECWPECVGAKLRYLYLHDRYTSGVMTAPSASASDIPLSRKPHDGTYPGNRCTPGQPTYVSRLEYIHWRYHSAALSLPAISTTTGHITGGQITSLPSLFDGGSGYDFAPIVTCGNATITTALTGDYVSGLTIVNGGSGFLTGVSYPITISRPNRATHPLELYWTEVECNARGGAPFQMMFPGNSIKNRKLKIKPDSVTCSPFVASYDFGPKIASLGYADPFAGGSSVVTLETS